VTWDILCNNLSAGLFLVGGLAELLAPTVFAPLAKALYPTALIFLLIDLALLTIDLGDPWRFHHMLRQLNLRSPMSVGVWSLTAFSLSATLAAVLSVFTGDDTTMQTLRQVVVGVGLVPGLASLVYKGVLFSTTAQPIWKEARWLGAFLTASAMGLGCWALLLIAMFMQQPDALPILRRALILLTALSLVAFGLVALNVRHEIQRLRGRRRLIRFAVGDAAVSMVVPLMCLLIPGDGFLLLGMAPALLGNVTLRSLIVEAPRLAGEIE
jgi:hypothetical protein